MTETAAGIELILDDMGGDTPLLYWVTGHETAKIQSSIAGAGFPALTVDNPACFKVGDKVFVSHVTECGKGLYGCGKIATIVGSVVSVEMDDLTTLDAAGGANGIISKAQNLAGWIGILGIYSHLPGEPSPLLEGAIDKGSRRLAIKGDRAVMPGDLVSLPEAGILGARVQTVGFGTVKDQDWTIATIGSPATASVSAKSPKAVTREGRLLGYATLKPAVGGAACGRMEGFVDRNTIENLPTAIACGCDPCSPLREVGCFQLIIAHGQFGPAPGYNLYYADRQFVAMTGKVFIRQSIASDLKSIMI
jgi:hypothetical protein